MCAFWNTQPVFGTVEDLKPVVDRPPKRLPDAFEWITLSPRTDVGDLARFLGAHYGESDDGLFTDEVSPAFLTWAFDGPNQPDDWIVGVRVRETGALVATICAWPWTVRVDEETHPTAQVGFLCVHPKLRHKRLTPLLIQEITRRIVSTGCFRAVYTGHEDLPGRVTTIRRHVRALRVEPLVRSGFWAVRPPMTPSRLQRLNRLPKERSVSDMRPVRAADAPALARFLDAQWAAFRVSPAATDAWVEHTFFHPDTPIVCFVRVDDDGAVTDAWSYFVKRTRVSDPARSIRAFDHASAFYTFGTTVDRVDLARDAMIHAKEQGCASWVDADWMDSNRVRRALRIEPNPSTLHLFLYNWGAFDPVDSGETAIVCW